MEKEDLKKEIEETESIEQLLYLRDIAYKFKSEEQDDLLESIRVRKLKLIKMRPMKKSRRAILTT